jgi:hypothetical protein
MRRLNPRNILDLLSQEFIAHKTTAISIGDRLLADGIAQLIRQCMEAASFEIEIDEILELSGRPKDDEDESQEQMRDPLSESQLQEALLYYRSSSTRTRTLSSMMTRHRFIKGQHHIRQMLR